MLPKLRPEPVVPVVEGIAVPAVADVPAEKKGRGRKAKAEPKKGKGGRKSKKQQELERQEAEAVTSQTAPIEPAIEAMPVAADVPAIEAAAPESVMEQAAEVLQVPAEEVEEAAAAAFDVTEIAPPAAEQSDEEALAIDGPWKEGHGEAVLDASEPEPARTDEAISIPEPVADIPTVEVAGEIAPLETVEKPVADDKIAEATAPTGEATATPDVPEPVIATPVSEPGDALDELSPLDDLSDLDDMPPLEAFAPEAVAAATETEPAPTPSAEPVAEVEEALEEVSAIDEEEIPAPAGAEDSADALTDEAVSGPAGMPLNEGEPTAPAIAAEDDFFAGMDETLPVLELDSGGDLGPMTSGRDPDALLAHGSDRHGRPRRHRGDRIDRADSGFGTAFGCWRG